MGIARAIRRLRFEFDVELIAVHIPGRLNDEADQLSRFTADAHHQRVLSMGVVRVIESRTHCPVTTVCQLRSPVDRIDDLPDPGDNSADAQLRPGSSLWCPGPHEFAGTLKRVRQLQRGAPVPHILLVPDMPGSPWWGLLQGSRVLQDFPAGTRLFEADISLPVPDSVAPDIHLAPTASVPWVARTFMPVAHRAPRKRGRRQPRH